jgi:hypothetical protein
VAVVDDFLDDFLNQLKDRVVMRELQGGGNDIHSSAQKISSAEKMKKIKIKKHKRLTAQPHAHPEAWRWTATKASRTHGFFDSDHGGSPPNTVELNTRCVAHWGEAVDSVS